MRVIHLWPSDSFAFTEPMAGLIDQLNCTGSEHVFCMKHMVQLKNEHKHVIICPELFEPESVSRLLMQYDYIVMHAMQYSNLALIDMPKSYLNRIIWVTWGHDLYKYSNFFSPNYLVRTIKPVLSRIKHSIIKDHIAQEAEQAKKHFACYVGAFEGDRYTFKKRYGENIQCYIAKTFSGVYNNWFDSEATASPHETFNIMVGHSAFPFLQHVAVLKALYKYRRHNIHLYIPLSYGEEEYASGVRKKAKDLFGDQVTILDQRLDIKEYLAFLTTIDCAIFHFTRQAALDNVYHLLRLGKKVYLKSDGILYYGLSQEKLALFPSEEVGRVSYDTLTDMTGVEQNAVNPYIHNLYDKQYAIQQWEAIFKQLQPQLSLNA